MDPAVPIVEVAYHADPPRVRRPDCEGCAAYAVALAQVRAEHLPQPQVVALTDNLSVEIAEHFSEAVRILEFKRRAPVVLAKPVRKRLRRRQLQQEDAGGMGSSKRPAAAPVRASINSSDTACGRKARTTRPPPGARCIPKKPNGSPSPLFARASIRAVSAVPNISTVLAGRQAVGGEIARRRDVGGAR
jgi:hypothetical protein